MQAGCGGQRFPGGRLYGQKDSQADGSILPVCGCRCRRSYQGRGTGYGGGRPLPDRLFCGKRRGKPAGSGEGVRQNAGKRAFQDKPSFRADDDFQHGGGKCKHCLWPEGKKPKRGDCLCHRDEFHRGGFPCRPVRRVGRLCGRRDGRVGDAPWHCGIFGIDRPLRKHGSREMFHTL